MGSPPRGKSFQKAGQTETHPVRRSFFEETYLGKRRRKTDHQRGARMETVTETLGAPVRHFDHVKWPLCPFQASDFTVYGPASLQLAPDPACFTPDWGRQSELAIFHAVQLRRVWSVAVGGSHTAIVRRSGNH